ncbi:MAG: hypothetical protein A2X94_16820 [Bdellovibrionales bacterium GWB1_55_8]|nr:MAG: hypothetical protein A2X94_16820 [Bdellovibrionales bacterium GWB1_55_8]
MYRVTIVAGPNRGSSFMIREGENSIGRQTGNAIVLQSARVSKRHCVLLVSGNEVTVQDEGSSNGTFVNGALTKKKTIRPGDRVSVGEYILEIDVPAAKKPKAPPPAQGFGRGVAIPGSAPAAHRNHFPPVGGMAGMGGHQSAPAAPIVPTDLKGKLAWFLEQRLMPFFYGLNLKYEWSFLVVGFFMAFIVANLLVSVHPLIESGREAVVKEAATRARFIAKLIAERNSPFLASRAESKLDIDPVIEKSDGVQLAVLVDMDSKVLAPRRANNFLTSGPEAVLAVQARDRFERNGSAVVKALDSESVTAIEPVLLYDSTAGRNVTVAMAIVTVDTSLATPDIGEMGVVYSKTLILTGLLGALIIFALYRTTLRPFQVLTDDMDKVLKGDLVRITREHKFSELNSLWDLIDSTLQRVPKGSATGQLSADSGPSIDEISMPVQMIGNLQKQPIVVCDSNRIVVYLNQSFEDVSGIRSDSAIGQTLSSQGREQSFIALVDDLLDRASSVGTAVDDYEFSGVAYKLHAASFGSGAGGARGYVVAAERQEG